MMSSLWSLSLISLFLDLISLITVDINSLVGGSDPSVHYLYETSKLCF